MSSMFMICFHFKKYASSQFLLLRSVRCFSLRGSVVHAAFIDLVPDPGVIETPADLNHGGIYGHHIRQVLLDLPVVRRHTNLIHKSQLLDAFGVLHAVDQFHQAIFLDPVVIQIHNLQRALGIIFEHAGEEPVVESGFLTRR